MKFHELLQCTTEEARSRIINEMNDGFRVLSSYYNFVMLDLFK